MPPPKMAPFHLVFNTEHVGVFFCHVFHPTRSGDQKDGEGEKVAQKCQVGTVGVKGGLMVFVGVGGKLGDG